MCEFNKEDVINLAKAILNDPIEYCENIHYIGRVPEYWCRYCEVESYSRENFSHKLNCPTLIAQDILTRNENYDKDGNCCKA